MEKRAVHHSKIILIAVIICAFLFIGLPFIIFLFKDSTFGNVALIPISGTITGDGGSYFGGSTVASSDIVEYLQEANDDPAIQAIILQINSPGGSAVASDEIATAVKKIKKPVISVIHEAGASGAYWIASASSYIIANRMSITGSIGVVSSYLEFSGLMEKYGVGYEQLTAGKYKDLGTPFRKLTFEEETVLQRKLDKIHDYFIKAVAANRHLSETKVRELATGEFYLGSEALDLGLIDKLGDSSTAEEHLKTRYNLTDFTYKTYQKKAGLLDILTGVFSTFSFKIGEGIGSSLTQKRPSFT